MTEGHGEEFLAYHLLPVNSVNSINGKLSLLLDESSVVPCRSKGGGGGGGGGPNGDYTYGKRFASYLLLAISAIPFMMSDFQCSLMDWSHSL